MYLDCQSARVIIVSLCLLNDGSAASAPNNTSYLNFSLLLDAEGEGLFTTLPCSFYLKHYHLIVLQINTQVLF